MATNTKPDDLQTILVDQPREVKAAQISDSDFAFGIQMEEAIAASLADRPSSSQSDGLLGVARTLPQPDMDSHIKKYQDRKHSEAESSKTREYLDHRIQDQRLTNNIGNVPEEYRSKFGDWHGASSSSSSSSSSKVLVEPEDWKLYFKGLVSEERVGDSDTVVAGAGIAICDSDDNLVFQSGKNLEAFEDGCRISSEATELEALVEGLKKALEFGFQKIAFFCHDDEIFLYVTNRLPPSDGKVAALVNQVTLLRRKFTYCGPSLTYCSHYLVANDNIHKFALKCARETIVSQTTSSLKETCFICYEDTDVAQMFSVDGCLHKYCFSCMKQHVEAKLHNGQIPRCPHDGCNFEVAVDSWAKFFHPNQIKILVQRVKELVIPVTQKVYCPDPKCSAVMSEDEVLKYSEASFIDAQQTGARICMKCLKLFCINCKGPWHHSMTCDDYRRDNSHSHEDEQMLKSLAKDKKWRQCPKCSHMVELVEGCYHITCRCKYEFCYTCGAEWKNKKATCTCPLWDEQSIIRNERQQRQQRLPELDGQRRQQVRIREQRREVQLRHVPPPPPQQQPQLQPYVGLEQPPPQPPLWDEQNIIRNERQQRLPELDGQRRRPVRIREQRREVQPRHVPPPPPQQQPQLQPYVGLEQPPPQPPLWDEQNIMRNERQQRLPEVDGQRRRPVRIREQRREVQPRHVSPPPPQQQPQLQPYLGLELGRLGLKQPPPQPPPRQPQLRPYLGLQGLPPPQQPQLRPYLGLRGVPPPQQPQLRPYLGLEGLQTQQQQRLRQLQDPLLQQQQQHQLWLQQQHQLWLQQQHQLWLQQQQQHQLWLQQQQQKLQQQQRPQQQQQLLQCQPHRRFSEERPMSSF